MLLILTMVVFALARLLVGAAPRDARLVRRPAEAPLRGL